MQSAMVATVGETVPEGADSVTIRCSVNGLAEARFDDIQLSIWESGATGMEAEECMCKTELVIYSISGRTVKILLDSVLPGGEHSVAWDGTDENGRPLGSGNYFCQLRSGNGASESRRMILLN